MIVREYIIDCVRCLRSGKPLEPIEEKLLHDAIDAAIGAFKFNEPRKEEEKP